MDLDIQGLRVLVTAGANGIGREKGEEYERIVQDYFAGLPARQTRGADDY
jgi:hypothetical protein